jgi:hypothetical protein
MPKEFTEEFKINGAEVLSKVKALIKEGKASKIIIKNEKGHTLIEVPLNFGAAVGAAGLIFAPALAAIGAVAALVTKCTIVVVKKSK